ncbi:hypothetical protein [Actinomadura roseirufa]|uniref:hypothetical protein n=1 Tax=Actinomadura roseirufa TaxID=2094049 RepID=UPI0010414709|nr:hypothetical protein [Actinomadura roseirufa]
MSDIESGAGLEDLPSKELHARAMRLAKERRDVGFLWDLLRAIPAAAASTGEVDRAEFDLLHGLSLLEEFTHAGEGDLADALRPFYIDYLAQHGRS